MKYNLKTLSLVGGLLACGSNIYGMEKTASSTSYSSYLSEAIKKGRVISATFEIKDDDVKELQVMNGCKSVDNNKLHDYRWDVECIKIHIHNGQEVFSIDRKNSEISNNIAGEKLWNKGKYDVFYIMDGEIMRNEGEFLFLSNMFCGCKRLISVDFSHLRSSKVKRMDGIFKQCESLVDINFKGFSARNVTDMSEMFSDCQSLTSLDLSMWNTKNVTDMLGMFYNCSCLKSVKLGDFKTNNVETMRGMFGGCKALNSIIWTSETSSGFPLSAEGYLNLSYFDTRKVSSMSGMFLNCSSVVSLDLSSFDTSKVKDMSYMFHGCRSLVSLNEKFKTVNVKNMGYMFGKCEMLEFLNSSSWVTSNVQNMSYMFSGCTRLCSVCLNSCSSVKTMEMMFLMCSNLRTVKLWGLRAEKVENMSGLFAHCARLINLDIKIIPGNNVASCNFNNVFFGCRMLAGNKNGISNISDFLKVVSANSGSVYSLCSDK